MIYFNYVFIYLFSAVFRVGSRPRIMELILHTKSNDSSSVSVADYPSHREHIFFTAERVELTQTLFYYFYRSQQQNSKSVIKSPTPHTHIPIS